ncbi:MAG: UvrD-helicase domain-containing protein, partial [Polyangiaceae bacterium]
AFDSATIATIHAFCSAWLHENAFASGRLFQEQQVDGRRAFGDAMRTVLRRDPSRDPKRACWLDAALRGGGSIDRIEQLLWNCHDARAVLRPEFDESDLAAALAAFPTRAARSPGVEADIKALGARSQTAGKIARCLNHWATLIDENRSAALFVRDAEDVDYMVEHLQALSRAAGTTALVCTAALELARVTPPFEVALAHALLGDVQRELSRMKRAAGQFDFGDMLSRIDDALRSPRGDAMVAEMRRRWRLVLVDEFQDTDDTQWSILRRAFMAEAEHGSQSVVTFVGDPKQSIYRFRGADVQAYLRAREEVIAAGGAKASLHRNFRATPALVGAQNRIFDQCATEPLFTGTIT